MKPSNKTVVARQNHEDSPPSLVEEKEAPEVEKNEKEEAPEEKEDDQEEGNGTYMFPRGCVRFKAANLPQNFILNLYCVMEVI
jgi:hypothetical protein